jgi:hemoglobin
MAGKQPGEYGFEDTSLRTIGGEDGVRKLVDLFYDHMQTLPEAHGVLTMHPDIPLARDKLTAFLTGWLGGPKRFSERWGPIRIPAAHAHLPITEADHDGWVLCMDRAIEAMDVPDDFKTYFKREIRVPAHRVLTRTACPSSKN